MGFGAYRIIGLQNSFILHILYYIALNSNSTLNIIALSVSIEFDYFTYFMEVE